jgi:hypothetical protein
MRLAQGHPVSGRTRTLNQLLQYRWAVRLSLGAVVCQEQAPSPALAPVVEEARVAVQQAAVVNLDETGWRQDRRQAWLWTAVSPELTVLWIDRRRGGPAVKRCWVRSSADWSGPIGGRRLGGSQPRNGPSLGPI